MQATVNLTVEGKSYTDRNSESAMKQIPSNSTLDAQKEQYKGNGKDTY